MTKYTTEYAKGKYRTIDTDHDSLFSLITEMFLDWRSKKNGKKSS